MTQFTGKKLLIAPLDWGLGHATRCIPIIRDLLNNQGRVWIACEGAQEKLLREEFPGLPFLRLRGYRVKYAKNGVAGKVLFQIPSILNSIRTENKWLKEQISKIGFDFVLSDNRYGLYNKSIHSIFITHQLHIKSPLGKWSESLLQRWNYRFIEHFDECWIPDVEAEKNLSGDLSHPQHFPKTTVKYIGPLSRLKKVETSLIKGQLLIIISGPEPQRTIFENIIIDEIVNYPGTATIVRGLPGEENIIPSTNAIKFYNHLTADQLNYEFMRAEFIISRSGYSTVMDIAALQKKSILIPTPGQTEQEYLSTHLEQQGFALSADQKKFDLERILSKANNFDYCF